MTEDLLSRLREFDQHLLHTQVELQKDRDFEEPGSSFRYIVSAQNEAYKEVRAKLKEYFPEINETQQNQGGASQCQDN
jgi:hypothetical protein